MTHAIGQVRHPALPGPGRRFALAVVAGLALVPLAGCSGDSSASRPTSAAPASVPASVRVTGPKVSVSLPPAAKRVPAPALESVSGFSYVAAGPGLRQEVAKSVKQNRQIVNATTIRSLVQGSDPFGEIVAYSVDPAYLHNSVFKQQFLVTAAASLAGPGSAAPALQEVSSRTVATAAGTQNVAATFFNSSVIVVRSDASLTKVVNFVLKYAKSARPTPESGAGAGSATPTAPPSPVG